MYVPYIPFYLRHIVATVSGTVYPRLHSANFRNTRSIVDDDRFPVETDLDLSIHGTTLTFHLERNDAIGSTVPVFTQQNGRIRRTYLPPKRVMGFETYMVYFCLCITSYMHLYVIVMCEVTNLSM